MKYCLLTAVAAIAVAAPAQARDGQGYVGIEGGVLFPRGQDVNGAVEFTTIQTPALPVFAGPVDRDGDGVAEADWDMGYDVGVIGGYDFGGFRLEAEFAYKKAKRDGFDPVSYTHLTLPTILLV